MGIVTEVLAWLVFLWCLAWGGMAIVGVALGVLASVKERRRLRERQRDREFLDKVAERDAIRYSLDWLRRCALKNKEVGEDAHKRISDNRKRVDLLEAYLDERLSAIEAKVFKCR